jgi:hypothetical protein
MRLTGRDGMVIALGKNLGRPVESSEIRVVLPQATAPTSGLVSGVLLPLGTVSFPMIQPDNRWLPRWICWPVRRQKSLPG